VACLSPKNKETSVAQERLSLRKTREILRLKEEARLHNPAIAREFKVSNCTVVDELLQKLFPENKRESQPK
jgi:hypothetical protein